MEKPPASVRFHYIKSNHFRVAHVDGVFGGVSPQGGISMTLFSERFPIPTLVEQSLEETEKGDFQLGKELSRTAREGIVRELEVSLTMNLEIARVLHKWLGDQLDRLDGQNGDAASAIDR